jgi:hypothetical protein
MSILRVLSAIALSATCLVPATVFACDGQTGKVIFEDKFADDGGGWNFGTNLTLKAPGAVLSEPAGDAYGLSAQNQTFNATEGDFCVEMSFPKNAKEVTAAIGVVFLAGDTDNYWVAEVYSDGRAGLYKGANGKFATVWEVPDATVKTDPADVNAIRAIVKGNAVTVLVNGKTIKTVRAQIPSGDFKFGFRGEYYKPSATPVEFPVHAFKATEAK